MTTARVKRGAISLSRFAPLIPKSPSIMCFLKATRPGKSFGTRPMPPSTWPWTPPTGFPMWGYAARHDKPSVGVLDPLFARAARAVCAEGGASVSLVQRKFNVGYSRAGRIVDLKGGDRR